MSSNYLQQVTAVIDTTSTFGTTLKQLKDNVTALQTQMSTLLADAPGTLDTLNEIAGAINDDPAFFSSMATANTTLQTNIDNLTAAAATARTALQTALQANIDGVATNLTTETTARGAAIAAIDSTIAGVQSDVDQNEADADAALATKFDKAGGVLTGSLAIAKSFPDVELKAGDEKRILFSDAGGGSTAAIKHVSTTLDFYAGGIAAGNKEMSIGTDGVDVSALKIDGTAVTPSAAEINAFDGRLDALEADPVTKTYVDTQVTTLVDAAPGALDTLNELAAALGDDANFATTITNSIAAVQADVDQNESDSDAAIAALQLDVNQNETDADAAIASETTARTNADTALSGRLDTLEADPTTATALAAVQADVDANEITAANAVTAAAGVAAAATAAQNTAMLAAVAAVQGDVDANEVDADTAIALKANKAGDTFTGDILLKNPSGNAVALRLSRADHPDMSCEWKISPSYVSSSKECLSVLAAGQPVAHFDERQRVSINKTDPDHTLDVAGDGKFSTGLHVGGLTDAANDSAAATAGVAVNQLYRNGSVVMIRVS